jgi:serine phosphatase RsbU (regulator of sigma subunit)
MVLPADQAVADTEARLPQLGELGMPEIEAAATAWRKTGRPDTLLNFSHGGENWVAYFNPYSVGTNTFHVGIVLPERDLLGNTRRLQYTMLAVIIIILALGLIRALYFARRYIRPIEALVRDTERISEGMLVPAAPFEFGIREFRRLAEAHEEMRKAVLASMELDKMKRDMKLAQEIQRGLLPTEPPDSPGFLVAGWNMPADETGGDYYDWLTLQDGRTLFALADATGHGIGPALMVAVCRAYIRAAMSNPDFALSTAVAHVSSLLHHDLPLGRFITAAVGILNPEQKCMSLVQAGHGPLYLYRALTKNVERLDADNVPLGIDHGRVFNAPRCVYFEPGDMLVMLTDGFFEQADPQGTLFGLPRLETFVQEHGTLGPEAFIVHLRYTVKEFASGQKRLDDLTIVVVKRELED